MDIKRAYDTISQCNKCGFCQVACPVFRATGHESGVARGRLALMRGIIEDRVVWNRELADPLFNCLGCGACTENCFGAVPTTDLIIKARSEYLERVGRSPVHRLLFDHLLPYPNRLHNAARAVALGKVSGISKLAKALGLLRVMGRDLARAEDIVERVPLRAFREKVRPGNYAGEGSTLSIAYFVGCGIDTLQQAAGHASLGLLKRIGKRVTVLGNGCCGLPAWTYGDMDAARRLARRNLETVCAGDADLIVTDCASCANFLKSYDRLFEGDPVRRLHIRDRMPEVRDMVEIIAQTGPGPAHPRVAVTYHDPCHAKRGQGIAGQAREILKQIPGAEFREMAEADWCCGGAGAYALGHYDLSMAILDRKMANLADTGADLLVTACPACMIQLSHGIRRHGLKTRVCHISKMVSG